jgi:hypothetical protein
MVALASTESIPVVVVWPVASHHRTNIDKYHPGHFGKVGMRYFHKTINKFWKPVINLEKVRWID